VAQGEESTHHKVHRHALEHEFITHHDADLVTEPKVRNVLLVQPNVPPNLRIKVKKMRLFAGGVSVRSCLSVLVRKFACACASDVEQ
jgi:hypothetical protein